MKCDGEDRPYSAAIDLYVKLIISFTNISKTFPTQANFHQSNFYSLMVEVKCQKDPPQEDISACTFSITTDTDRFVFLFEPALLEETSK